MCYYKNVINQHRIDKTQNFNNLIISLTFEFRFQCISIHPNLHPLNAFQHSKSKSIEVMFDLLVLSAFILWLFALKPTCHSHKPIQKIRKNNLMTIVWVFFIILSFICLIISSGVWGSKKGKHSCVCTLVCSHSAHKNTRQHLSTFKKPWSFGSILFASKLDSRQDVDVSSDFNSS